MFENDDFVLDEEWFTEHLPNEASILNASTSGQIVQKPSSLNAFSLRSNCSDKPENSKLEVSSPKKVTLKRKFPGPAGLFPEKSDDSTESHQNILMHSDSLILNTQYLCSQNYNSTFEEPAWTDMCKDFKEHDTKSSLLDIYNIEWIRNHIAHNLINRKVPILAGIIKKIKSTSKSPIFLVADPTGELEALISPDLYEDLSEFLNVNSVLVLKKFSILTVNKQKHYLNITTDNLVRIYTYQNVTEGINIVHIQKISNEDLKQEIKSYINKHKENNIQQHIGFGASKFQKKTVLDNATNSSCFKSNQYNTNMSCTGKSNSVPKMANDLLLKMNQNCSLSNTRNLNRSNKESVNLVERPSIFEQRNNSLDLDLSLDDFQDDFAPPEFNDVQNCNAKHARMDSKQAKLGSDKCKSTTQVDSQNIVLKHLSSKSDGLPSTNLKNQGNLDCSQISILTQNNENPDIIREIFSDLDAAALFDEDF